MRQRYALCVGINEYPGEGNDLAGCVNDALDWAELLKERGYTPLAILDSAATKVAILSTLRAMLELARRGDRVVFTFSGHGTWIPDIDGDEKDGRDEALCPYDFASGVITDDELHDVLQQRRLGVRVTILSDSCHSGTVARGLYDSRTDAKARYLPPAQFLRGTMLSEAHAVQGMRAKSVSRAGAILVSGCADLEYSYDAHFDGRANGAFTRSAIDTLRYFGTMPVTYRKWHEAIRTALPSTSYPQSPQLGASYFQRRSTPLD